MELKKATRKQVKLRLNISAPSGAGKTYSALRMAKGLCGNWSKIALIDTENGSGSLYSHLGDYNVIDLLPPFTPERYTQAINACVSAGMEVIIIDSTSHEWATLLEENELLAQARFRGNTWSAWSQTTPRHDRFVNSVLHCPAHIITCTRSKTETVMGDDKKVKKVGMKDVQREGWEYELTVSLNIDRDTHFAMPSKDRTNLFEGKNPFLITEETGESIKNWCESGAADKSPEQLLTETNTITELANAFKSLSKEDQIRTVALKDELKLKYETPEQAKNQKISTEESQIKKEAESALEKMENPQTSPDQSISKQEASLRNSKDIFELQDAYKKLSPSDKSKFKELKDELKRKLTVITE